MKIIEFKNVGITVEYYDRFNNIVNGFELNEKGTPVKFLGKYIVGTNYTDDEIIRLYAEK